METSDWRILSFLATNLISALFASPSTGGLVSLIKILSPGPTETVFVEEFGVTLTERINVSSDTPCFRFPPVQGK